jgi:riboflavin-specific deaminase-like protein
MTARSRPFVLVNMAMTADGKIATANRKVPTFSSARDQEHLYELRATADAVMAGARTIDLNDIKLGPGGKRFQTERVSHGLSEYNLRVIVSGSGSINPKATIFKHRFSPIIILTTERPPNAVLKRLRSVAEEVFISGETDIDFNLALEHLRRKWKVKRLLCEGGGELNAPLFQGALVDELHLTICPKIFGGQYAPTIADGNGLQHLIDARQYKVWNVTRVEDELFLVFRAANKSNKKQERASGAPSKFQDLVEGNPSQPERRFSNKNASQIQIHLNPTPH